MSQTNPAASWNTIQLSGASSLLFWRNSATGVMEARPRGGRQVELNQALHANA